MKILKHYIFIDKKKLISGRLNAGKIVGSVKQLTRQNIKVDGVILGYFELLKLLGKKKYFSNKDYYIKRTVIERSKNKV